MELYIIALKELGLNNTILRLLIEALSIEEFDSIFNGSFIEIQYKHNIDLKKYSKMLSDEISLKNALDTVNEYLEGNIKLVQAKKIIREVQIAAREAEGNPASQAAARAIGATTATINTLTSSLGLVFYGSASIAYSTVGVEETPDVYEAIAARECKNMEDDLLRVAIEDEPNPAKIKWSC